MEKYKKILEDKFDAFSAIISILCAIIMLCAIVIEMEMPIDAKELEHHYSQLETIKQDASSIYELENVDITIDKNSMSVMLKGKYHNLNAFFDENNNYINATIIDNRVGSNLVISILIIVLAFGLGYILSYFILAILCIPILIHALIMFAKKKWYHKK